MELSQIQQDLKGICNVSIKGNRIFLLTTPKRAESLDSYLQSAFPIESGYKLKPSLMMVLELEEQSKYEIIFTPYFPLDEREKQQAIHEIQERLPHAIKDYITKQGKSRWRD